jgi:hypothetical protein
MIYAAGEQVRVVSEEELVDALFREIRKRRSPR